jgi:ABC-type transport system involved in multi-copper enzyme maturation permease subunit
MSVLSTTSTLPGSGRGRTADGGIPFSRLARAELRKLTDTRTSRGLLIAMAAATPIVIAVMLAVASPRDLTYMRLIDFTITPQKILLPALGILVITSEWSQRTGLVTFTLVPDRRRVLLAKGTATLGLGLAVIAVVFAAAAVGNLLVGLRHGDGSWAFGAQGFGEIILVQVSALVEGLAFGMLLRSSAAAVVAYYVVPSVWSALFSASAGLKSIAPWVDLNQAQGNLYNNSITGIGWVQLLVASSIWIFLPLAAGIIRALRGEIKSA